MFKILKIEPFVSHYSEDENVNKMQLQLQNLVTNLRKTQENLFILEKYLKNSNENVIDRVIFGGPHLEHTSTKPDELQPPVYAIGIGRLQKGISVQISTLFHTSNQIDAGKFYGLDEHYQLVPIENRKEAVLIGIDQRLGLIIQQNLPQIALL